MMFGPALRYDEAAIRVATLTQYCGSTVTIVMALSRCRLDAVPAQVSLAGGSTVAVSTAIMYIVRTDPIQHHFAAPNGLL